MPKTSLARDENQAIETWLVGSGVMGRAIALAHVVCNVPFVLSDKQPESLLAFQRELASSGVDSRWVDAGWTSTKALVVGPPTSPVRPRLVIESVAEDLATKQEVFQLAASTFGSDAILCSNTSTLRLTEIQQRIPCPERVCGMHFFMPVHERPAVEVVSTAQTSPTTVDEVVRHANRLGKRPIRCRDATGFIVNRMLSPYLNQSLRLLCHGVTAERIERCSRVYGMPMSPLELIDWIGARTMYQAGRAYANAYPARIDPSPIVPALVKRKLLGRQIRRGLYDYDDSGRLSPQLSVESSQLVETYGLKPLSLTDADVMLLLAVPMWLEALSLLSEGVTESMETIDLAMVGGLGFHSDLRWSDFFRELGDARIQDMVARWSGVFRSMKPTQDQNAN